MAEATVPASGRRGLAGARAVVSLAAVGVFALAAGLRWYQIGFQSLWLDEAAAVSFASGSVADIFRLTFGAEPNPPLYYLALHFWMLAFGQSEVALRSLSALAGAASVPLLFLIGRRLFSTPAGLLGAAVLAINPFHIWLSQETRNFALLAAFSLLTLYLLLRLLDRPSQRLWVGYALALLATLYLHVYGLLFTCALVAIVALYRPNRQWLRDGAIATGVPLLLYAPWLATLFKHVGTTQWRPTLGLADLLNAMARSLTMGEDYFWEFGGDWWLLWVTLAILAPHVWRANGEERRNVLVVTVWFAVPLALSYLISFVTPIFWPRYHIIIVPALCLAIGVTLAAASRLFGPTGPLLLALLAWTAWPVLEVAYGTPMKEDYRAATAYLRENVDTHDVVVLIANYVQYAFAYYGIEAQTPLGGVTSTEQVEQALRPLASAGGRIWLAEAHETIVDPDRLTARWLEENCRSGGDRAFRGVKVTQYLCEPRVEAPSDKATELGVSFGDSLRLAAFRVLDAPSVPAGSSLRIAIYWEAAAAPAEDLHAFVHLLDGNGTLVAQDDRPPGGPGAPTSAWRAGELYLDDHRLTLPADLPPGEYSLVVGLYSPQDPGRRLPVNHPAAENGSLPLARIEVEPRAR